MGFTKRPRGDTIKKTESDRNEGDPSTQFQKSLRMCGHAHRSMDGLMSARAAARGSRGLPRLPGAAFRWRQFIPAFSCTKTHQSHCPGTFGQNFDQTSVITSSSPWPLSAQCVDLLRRHGERCRALQSGAHLVPGSCKHFRTATALRCSHTF